MKTFALLVCSLFTIASFAADRRPTVILNGNRNYEIVVDGKRYNSDYAIDLSHLRKGSHNIRVYEMNRGIFRNRARLVSSSEFRLWDNDLYINIDRFGNVQVRESRYTNNRDRRDDRGWNDRNQNDNRDWNDRNQNDDRNWNDRGNRKY